MFSWFKRLKLRKDVAQALEDGRLDEDEIRNLKSRSAELGLETSDLTNAVSKHFQAETAPIRKRIEATRRFSPEDEAQMLEIGKRFNSTVDFNDTFYRFRQLWLAENNHPLDPRPVDAPFILQPSERCYLASPSIWKRVKTVKHRVMSRGHVQSIRIMKG